MKHEYTKDDLRAELIEMGADTAKSMMDALCDGALLGRLQPSDMSEEEFQAVVEDLHGDLDAASRLGRRGRAVNSQAQQRAARTNGCRGGHPPVPPKRKKIAAELLTGCPDEGLADHQAIARAISRGDTKEKILLMPELDLWPDTYVWLKHQL
jgi:hypothetical protein